MIGRMAMGMIPLGLGGAFYSGAIPVSLFVGGDSAFETTVAASPAQVRSAIRDLEFTEILYGGPAGSSTPVEVRDTAEDGRHVWVMSVEGRPAFRFVAHLEPSGDGQSTAVRAEASFVDGFNTEGAPLAFRTVDLPRTAFAAALEHEMNPLQPEAQRLTPEAARLRRSEKITRLMTLQIATNPMAVGAQARRMELDMRKGIDDSETAVSDFRQRHPEIVHAAEAQAAAARSTHGSPVRPAMDASRPSVDASRPAVDLSR